VIVEERTYHVFTGKLPELVRLYETEGTELQQRILGTGLDLGRQHAGGGSPRLSLVTSRLEELHPPSGERQFPGAGRPDRARAHYHNVVRCSHLYFL